MGINIKQLQEVTNFALESIRVEFSAIIKNDRGLPSYKEDSLKRTYHSLNKLERAFHEGFKDVGIVDVERVLRYSQNYISFSRIVLADEDEGLHGWVKARKRRLDTVEAAVVEVKQQVKEVTIQL